MMDRTGLKVWLQCLLMISIFLSGCAKPIVRSRLVTIEVVKPPEVSIQEAKTIGVLPFKSPEKTLALELQAKMVKGLTRELFIAQKVQAPKDFQTNPEALRRLGRDVNVDGLLLGEVTEYSVQASRDTKSMLAHPEFGTGEPAEYHWIGISEDPSIGDMFYFSLENLKRPKNVEVVVTRISYSLAVNLRLIEVESGSTIWEEEVSRHLEKLSLPGPSVNAEDEVRRIQASIVEEVASQLRPQESTVQRMLRAPLITLDPKLTKLMNKGIDAAARNNWEKAETLFLQVLEKDPDQCVIIGNLGVVYERSGKFLEALATYERAYRCQPLDPTYRYYSDDLRNAFAPDLNKEDLPTLVIGVRSDGIIYLDGGESRRNHPGDNFVIYRTESLRDPKRSEIKVFVETEFARGEVIEVREQMSLGRLLLFDPNQEIKRGDLVRVEAR